jgi:hypothetical protein
MKLYTSTEHRNGRYSIDSIHSIHNLTLMQYNIGELILTLCYTSTDVDVGKRSIKVDCVLYNDEHNLSFIKYLSETDETYTY